MIASPVVLASAVVTILAIVLYYYTGFNAGRMRVKHGIHAPAASGHPEFDRAFRVQMNMLEHLPTFLPLLWLATLYFSPYPLAAPALGVVWIIGRALYMAGYMQAPEKRELGFMVAAVAEVLLLILAIVGVVMAWLTVA